MSNPVHFPGRVLFLCADPSLIERQLAGENLTLTQAGTLRDDISTDEITPLPTMTVWDERLARVPYAGIRLILAESFERIYRQNADNVGLITTSDFSVIERVQRGEPLDLDALLEGRDALAAAIVRSGGLMRYGQQHLHRSAPRIHAVHRASPQPTPPAAPRRPMTLAEKIIERHAFTTADAPPRIEPGAGLFVRADWRFIHGYYTGMVAHLLHGLYGRPLVLHEPASIVAFEDHMSYAARSPAHVGGGLIPTLNLMVQAHRDFVSDGNLTHHGALPGEHGNSGSQGISHPMMTEHCALPGQLVAGTDSHTPHAGALGCLAFGVGSTDMANAFVTGAVRLAVPPQLLVKLISPLSPGHRHRLRRQLHRRQTRRFRPVPRRAVVGRAAGPARGAGRQAVPAIRRAGGARLLHRARLPGRVRAGRRRAVDAGLRRLRQRRARLVQRGWASHHQRDQPQLPWAIRARAGVVGQPGDGGGERGGGGDSVVCGVARRRVVIELALVARLRC